MAPGDFKSIAGRQRAVWTQPGGHVLVGSAAEHFEAVVIEAGTVVRDRTAHETHDSDNGRAGWRDCREDRRDGWSGNPRVE